MIGEYIKNHVNLDEEDGLAVFLCCQRDKAAQAMIDFLKKNPNIDYTDLLAKAVELAESAVE